MTTTRTRTRTPEELETIAHDGAERFADADAATVLAWAAETFGDGLVVACSMADAVLPHLASEALPGVDVLFLETGYHFAQTQETKAAVADALDITLVEALPELTVAEQDAKYGPRLHDRDPAACCRMRKVEPLRRALLGYDAWVTGVRREEGPTRADAPVVSWDAAHGLVKINPLVRWTLQDLIDHTEANLLPVNSLLGQGYPSIGCAPCTRPVAPGEDPRAGRWAGFAKTECGIHT